MAQPLWPIRLSCGWDNFIGAIILVGLGAEFHPPRMSTWASTRRDYAEKGPYFSEVVP